MKKLLTTLLHLLFLLNLSFANLKVVATYPWIGELVKEIGKEKVSIYVMAKGTEDPHYIVPKPSHIARLRSADLLIIQGASIEIGFLPSLISQSNNPQIQPGNKGFLDLSQFVEIIEKPEIVNRAMGDVHPEGNPHYNLDPHNIPVLAQIVKEKLCELDPQNCSYYQENLKNFLEKWQNKTKEWDQNFSKLKGVKVIEYHKIQDYLIKRYEMVLIGTIEELPGIPPTAKYIDQLIKKAETEKIKFVIVGVYNEKKVAEYVASKIGAKLVILPHDVGALPQIKNLFDLFDFIQTELSR